VAFARIAAEILSPQIFAGFMRCAGEFREIAQPWTNIPLLCPIDFACAAAGIRPKRLPLRPAARSSSGWRQTHHQAAERQLYEDPKSRPPPAAGLVGLCGHQAVRRPGQQGDWLTLQRTGAAHHYEGFLATRRTARILSTTASPRFVAARCD
jgi:hypothetical protein